MFALKCDRCGGFYENYTKINHEMQQTDTDIINSIRPYTNLNHRASLEHSLIDLCPACAKSFCEWMDWKDRISDYIPYLLESEPKKDEEAETE